MYKTQIIFLKISEKDNARARLIYSEEKQLKNAIYSGLLCLNTRDCQAPRIALSSLLQIPA